MTAAKDLLTRAIADVPVVSIDRPSREWPAPMGDAAFHGIAGSYVEAADPHTEADRHAVLAQFLVGFGCMVGRGAYFITDGTRQHPNEFLACVGPTSGGRKGTAWAHARRPLALADAQWASGRVVAGLSSGEGLIHNVRDPLDADPGVSDKRLLVVEQELAAVLKTMRRDGNTLSAVLRNAWDGDTLAVLTRKLPLRADGAHVSIIGHITGDEFLRLLQQTDAANGLLNRFLLVATKRSKYLPDGGTPDEQAVMSVASVVRDMAAKARTAGRILRAPDADDLWRDVYAGLTDRPAGLLGSATSRAAPHVMRLALTYALLDGLAEIRLQHMQAGLAFWQYVEDSTAFFLGDSLGDPVADRILEALNSAPAGITKSEAYRLSNGHWAEAEVNQALNRLVSDGRATVRKKPTKGRPAELYLAAKYAKEETKGAA